MKKALVCILALAATAQADEVRISGGGTLRGWVSGEEDGRLWVELKHGRVGVPLASVEKVDREHDHPVEQYRRKLEEISDSTRAEDFCALAMWCHWLGMDRFIPKLVERHRDLSAAPLCTEEVCVVLEEDKWKQEAAARKKAWLAKQKEKKNTPVAVKPPPAPKPVTVVKREVVYVGIRPGPPPRQRVHIVGHYFPPPAYCPPPPCPRPPVQPRRQPSPAPGQRVIVTSRVVNTRR